MTGDRRRLALFLSGLSGGGAQRRMLTLSRAFAERGHAVDLVVVRSEGPFRPDVSPLVRLVALEPPLARLPWIRSRKGRWVLTGVPALAEYLRRERPEVLLSTSHPANIAALWARRLARVPTRLAISANVHLSRSDGGGRKAPPRFRLWQARRFYPWADAVIANADGIAEDLARVTGWPRERVRTIHNPVVTPELQEKMRAPLDHPWFAPSAPPVLLGIGKLKPQKDFATLLRAFSGVRAVRSARLLILGEGEEKGRLEAMARDLGVAADAAFPGFVPNPFPYIARASVFVLSSAWEGFSNVTAEALACGCPVVSTDCPGGGPRELLKDGAYGPLVPVGDDAAMARAILSVLDDPPAPSILRARAAEFSVDRAVDRYLEAMLEDVGR